MIAIYLSIIALIIGLPISVQATEKAYEALDMIQAVADACVTDMQKHCNTIKPGQDHFIACLYSHHDQVSEQCSSALSNADPRLEQYAAEAAESVYVCLDDFKKYCTGTAIGDGRYLRCLKKHEEKVSSDCKGVMEKTGFW